MRKILKIKVTAEDIEKGRRKNPFRCAIARAAKRVLKKVVSVGGDTIDFKYSEADESNYCDLPKKAKSFISRFDEKKTVKPFTFQVSAPVQFIR